MDIEKRIENIKNELLGNEYSIIELSNELQELDCEDVCEFGNWDELLESGNVVVAIDKFGEDHIIIDFQIIASAGEDEIIEATTIRIMNIEEY